ncbi:MAG: tRNA uridine-5-carboxymethylaminomethyl(34) synthesis GTPase MnmE, partial [Pseudomonadota bacterium]
AMRNALAPELVVEHIRAALSALGAITGETYSEDILDSVFDRFCIGK